MKKILILLALTFGLTYSINSKASEKVDLIFCTSDMKKLLGIMVLGLLLSGNAYADEDMLLIQCQSDDPKLSKFKPLYEIYPKTAKARAGPIDYVINYFAEDGILISSVNDPIMVSFIFFYRNTGKYKHTKNFPAKKEGGVEKQIQEFGTCVKKEKVF